MKELRNPAYWLGHLFTMVATVIGVYYAAIVGFETALKLDLLKEDRSSYAVSESLYKELSFNVSRMNSYIEIIQGKPYVTKTHLAGIRLNDLIFKASMNAEGTFSIHPTLLTEISNYYFSLGNAIEHYYASNMASPASLIVIVKDETAKLDAQQTLLRLSEYNEALAKRIRDSSAEL